MSGALEVAGLTKSFGGHEVLHGVDLRVSAGTVTAVVGASGCGKTTLLRLIAGFENPDAGTVHIAGREVAGAGRGIPAHRRDVGYVAQDGALFPHLTVAANIAYGLPHRDTRRVAELLHTVSLDESYATRRPHELSGGQQQRVALARALARRPAVMLLDEPFSALDTGLRAATRKAVSALLAEAGVTTLLVTHDQEEALSVADQVAVMRDGRFTGIGTPQQVYRDPGDRFTAEFLGDCVLLPCTVTAGVAECALGRLPVPGAVDGAATVMLRPEQLVATVLTDDSPAAADERGVATVLASEFRGHDVILTVDLGTDTAPIAVRQHSVAPPDVDAKVRLTVTGTAVVFPRNALMFDRIVDHLSGFDTAIAVHTDEGQLTYADLGDRVACRAAEFGLRRRLVLLETRNDVDTLVSYLGAVAGGHVVLPLPVGGDHRAVVDVYDPDTIVRDGTITFRHRPRHELHPDLALLLSTSGSTGSPKLVRLSRANLDANAGAIATYLDIRADDRAATTLPMSYCYGLSVIHSHLLRGAGLILTDHSVVDDAFWQTVRHHRATTFAGVPHTFELLDRIGFDEMELPDLRYLTQAGGRLAPDQVRRFADLGERNGWQLFVMYGATEATARMAYLPPELAHDHPGSIGVPVPGGSFTLRSIDGMADDAGELCYTGPNVMLGYANDAADLALGRTVDEFRTGDIARLRNGLYEIVGRSSRFVKLYGLRIDLQRVETTLRADGVHAICTDGDGLLLVAAAEAGDRDVARLSADASGLPRAAIRVFDVEEPPRLPSGKPDYPAVRDLAADRVPTENLDLRGLFADVLQLDPAVIDGEQSFVDLGGNSLSYVTMSVRLERALGHLPAGWPSLPLRDLEAASRPRRWWGATLETSVALRALAIVLVAGSHAELWVLWGGAHILLGVAGYNFGRFCLTPLPRPQRIRHLRNTIAWIAIPAISWVAVALVVTNDYAATNLLLAQKFLGPQDSMTAGRLWFVEVVVWVLVALTLVFWLPLADRWERRRPFAVALGFLAVGLALRYDVFGFDLGRDAWFTVLAFWFFAVGWAAAKSSTVWQRLAVTAVLAVGVVGYFGQPGREALVFVALTLLIWLPAIRCPSALTVTAGLVAEASLFIYLTHYQVYPLFGEHRLLGVVVAVGAGIALTQSVTLLRRMVRVHVRPALRSPAVPVPR